MRRVALAILLILLVTVAPTACGRGNQSAPSSAPARTEGQSSIEKTPSTATPSPPGATAAGSQIVIFNMAYTVPPSVSPGQQLTIVNNDEPAHTVTADENNLFDIRVSGGGGIMNFTAPTTPGTYPFHCNYHANMHGVLTVQ
jgi:plastocyanin